MRCRLRASLVCPHLARVCKSLSPVSLPCLLCLPRLGGLQARRCLLYNTCNIYYLCRTAFSGRYARRYAVTPDNNTIERMRTSPPAYADKKTAGMTVGGVPDGRCARPEGVAAFFLCFGAAADDVTVVGASCVWLHVCKHTMYRFSILLFRC